MPPPAGGVGHRQTRMLPSQTIPWEAVPAAPDGRRVTVDGVRVNGSPAAWRTERTLPCVDLEAPLLPGDFLARDIRFRLRLPRFRDRLGYRSVNCALAGWYSRVPPFDAGGLLHGVPCAGLLEFVTGPGSVRRRHAHLRPAACGDGGRHRPCWCCRRGHGDGSRHLLHAVAGWVRYPGLRHRRCLTPRNRGRGFEVVHRGSIVMPVCIKAKLSDDTGLSRRWDGAGTRGVTVAP